MLTGTPRNAVVSFHGSIFSFRLWGLFRSDEQARSGFRVSELRCSECRRALCFGPVCEDGGHSVTRDLRGCGYIFRRFRRTVSATPVDAAAERRRVWRFLQPARRPQMEKIISLPAIRTWQPFRFDPLRHIDRLSVGGRINRGPRYPAELGLHSFFVHTCPVIQIGSDST